MSFAWRSTSNGRVDRSQHLEPEESPEDGGGRRVRVRGGRARNRLRLGANSTVNRLRSGKLGNRFRLGGESEAPGDGGGQEPKGGSSEGARVTSNLGVVGNLVVVGSALGDGGGRDHGLSLVGSATVVAIVLDRSLDVEIRLDNSD